MKWGIDSHYVWHAVSDEGKPVCGREVAGMVETSRAPASAGAVQFCAGCLLVLAASVADIPVPGQPGETIDALTDCEVDDVVSGVLDEPDDFPESWTYALACEVKQRRAASVCKYCDMGHREHRAGCPMLVLCEADREALRWARVFATKGATNGVNVAEAERALRALDRLIGGGE